MQKNRLIELLKYFWYLKKYIEISVFVCTNYILNIFSTDIFKRYSEDILICIFDSDTKSLAKELFFLQNALKLLMSFFFSK